MKIMRYLKRIASVFTLAILGMWVLTSCEGADLYNVGAPDWISDKVDSIANSKTSNVISVVPNPANLGAADNTTAWWTEFTDDIKIEPGEAYEVKFVNYGGGSNWNNFVIILRNAAKDYEYGVFRSDNWCWSTDYPDGANSDSFCQKQMESSDRNWATWLKAMDRSKCTATITNSGNGTAEINIIMIGSDGVTYKQTYKNIEVKDKDDLYFSFTVDNSHVEFVTEFVDIPDSEPASMTLTGAPKKVMLGTTFEDAFANVGAVVTYENELTKTVEAADLTLQSIPDMNSVGTKTLVAVYNKTYLGGNSTKPLVATVTFEVVDKMYTTLGNLDNSTPFFGARSDLIKIGPKESFITSFTNYTNGQANWNNFIVVLSKGDLTLGAAGEYAVLRADNYGWGNGYGACTPSCSHTDWGAWLAAMNGGKVNLTVTNNGDGTADVEAVTVGSDGNLYTQTYKGINTIDPNDFYLSLTMEGAHLEFDSVVGEENNTSPFFGARSGVITVPAGQTVSTRFRNYTNGLANWNNYLLVICKADLTLGAAGEYAVLRADNYGWGNSYAGCTPACSHTDWAAWLAAMNEGLVTVSVTNKGDGTVDVKAVTKGSDGVEYTQTYTGISPVDAADVNMYLTIEGAHIVFE